MTARSFVIVVLLALLVPVVPGRADDVSPRPAPSPEERQRRAEFTEKLTTARRLLRARQYQPAADLLETLYQEYPGEEVVQSLLMTCYRNLSQYAKVEMLARRVVEKNPRRVNYWVWLAEALAEQGKADEAAEAYRQAVRNLPVFSTSMLRQVISSMRTNGLEDGALRLIDSLRLVTGDALLFAVERGEVLESRREYAAAAREYLPALATDTTIEAAEAERRLLALLSFPESAAETEAVLLAEGERLSGRRAVRLLAAHYLKSGNLDRAYEFAIRQDSLEGGNGAVLVQYLRECRERKLWPALVRMASYMLSRPGRFPGEMEARFLYGEALTEMGRYDEAVAVYEALLQRAVVGLDSADALYALGRLHLEYLNDYEQALQYFRAVTRDHRRGLSYPKALMAIPRCYLRMGDLTLAREAYLVAAARSSSEDVQEEAAYYTALIAFFEKQYDTALAGWRKLVVEYPRGFYVNDALKLLVMFAEAGRDTAALYDVSNALYFRERRMTDSVRFYLRRTAGGDEAPLGDWALLELADVELEAGDTAAAQSALERLVEEYPDSYYAPYGIKQRADLLSARNPASDEALRMYRELLERYPDYPFITDVRKRLRMAEDAAAVG